MSKADKRERQKQNRELARQERERLMRRDRQMKAVKLLALLLTPIIALAIIVSIVGNDDDKDSSSAKPDAKIRTSTASGQAACDENTPVKDPPRTFTEQPPKVVKANKTYLATVCTSEGAITLELDTVTAPIASNNFVFLAGKGFYDGLSFHRAAENFVIQGGDPNGDGTGGPGYSVTGEVPTDNYPVGALAAAKGGADPPGTFGSQFFIVTGENGATLPNDYARFGSVVDGLDVAQKIEKLAPENGDGTPTKKVKIIQVVVTVEDGAPATTTTSAAANSSSTTSTTAP